MKQKVFKRHYKCIVSIFIVAFCVLFLLQSTVAAHATEYVVDEDKLITEPYDPKLFDTMSCFDAPGSRPTIKVIFQNIIEYYAVLTSPVYKIYENTGYGSFDLLLNGGLIKEYMICTFKDGSRIVLLLKDKDLGEDWNKEIYDTCVEYVQRYSKPYLIKKSKDSFIIYDSDNITEMIAPDDYIYYWVSVKEYIMIRDREERERIRKEKYG
ncbi:MAG: hypothetical protein IKM87_03770 [Clostridia bacterium]|nr:hypothetical protein [Clostridia bacterium]